MMKYSREDVLNGNKEWLNEQAAIILGGFKKDLVGIEWLRMPDGICITKANWNPAEDIRDAIVLEEKIKEMGLIEEYSIKLLELIDESAELYDSAIECCLYVGKTGPDLLFAIANAASEQRTKAFLLAVIG